MPSTLPTPVLPKRIPHEPHKPSTAIQVSPLLLEAAGSEPEEVLQKLHTSKDGLSEEEAERRLQEYGPNVVARDERHPHIQLLGKALINPLVILLLVLAAFSFLTGDSGPAASCSSWWSSASCCASFRRPGPIPPPPSSGR